MRISKYTPYGGVGLDNHMKLPGAVPPAPAPVPILKDAYGVIILAPWGALLTGKWSLTSVQTEGKGDILWGYDWGMGQVHIPVFPHYVTTSLPILALGSTTKYFLPSFAVKEAIDGGALAGSGSGPVAVSFPAYCIPTQQCHDVGGVGFCFPSSVCFQDFSTRWVGFCFGDFLAGSIGVAADALSAAILSKFGGNLFKNTKLDDVLFGGLASSFMSQSVNVINALPDGVKIVEGVLGVTLGGFVFAEGAYATVGAFGALLLAPLAGWGGGLLANEVGDSWGSEEGDTGIEQPTPPVSPGPSGGSDAGMDAGGSEPDAGTPSGGEPDSGGYSEPTDSSEPDGGMPDSDPDSSGGVCEPDADSSSEDEPDSGGYSEPTNSSEPNGGNDR